uniref:Cytospin-A-like n=1 Tax=Saccoglossus kowalevskii TaxID=10224 RepID=A0ABM0GIZ2_SACKO|nr:PREDICTED: cytospin-A-like [Saccoglossus kowalevskii]
MSSTDGWSEIQTLLQQTQQENNDMRQRVEKLKLENQALKDKLHEIGAGFELKTDSEKALLLNLETCGTKSKSPTVSPESSPQDGEVAEAVVAEQSPDCCCSGGTDRTATCTSDDDAVFVPEERLLPSESSWEVQSIRSEGSVVCLQDRIHQMEENHHSVNEELQATLQELQDLQESVNDLSDDNDRLVEEKSILLEALCSQTEKLQKSKTEISHLKETLEENDVSYDADAFDNCYVADRSEIEQQILELMNNQDGGLKELLNEATDGKESDDMIVALKEKVNDLEVTLEGVISEKIEVEKDLSEYKINVESDQIELGRLQNKIEHERARSTELLNCREGMEKSDFEVMIENLQREKDVLETEKSDLEDSLAKSLSENSKLCNTIAKLEEESERNKTVSKCEIKDLQEEIEKLKAEKGELETEVGNLKDSLEEMDVECERHLAEKQQDAATIMELQQMLKTIKQQKSDIEKALFEFRRKTARDEDEWKQFQADLQTAVVIANDIRNEVQEELDNLRRDRSSLQEKVDKQAAELQQLRRPHGLSDHADTGKNRKPGLQGVLERRNSESGLKRFNPGANDSVKLSVKNLVQSIENAASVKVGGSPPTPTTPPTHVERPSFERRRSIGGKGSEPKQVKATRRLSSPLFPPSDSNKLSSSSAWKKMDEPLGRDKPAYRLQEPTAGRERGLRHQSEPKDARLAVSAATQPRYNARRSLTNIITRKINTPHKDNQEESNGVTSPGRGPGSASYLHPPMAQARRSSDVSEKKDPLTTLVKEKGGSKRNALLKWCQEKTQGYKGIDITNFSSSWNDGLAFCALLHNYLPQKIPYYELNNTDKKRNFKLAFEAAESVGITSILAADDMASMERPDWQSIMTYVSAVYKHFEG